MERWEPQKEKPRWEGGRTQQSSLLWGDRPPGGEDSKIRASLKPKCSPVYPADEEITYLETGRGTTCWPQRQGKREAGRHWSDNTCYSQTRRRSWE